MCGQTTQGGAAAPFAICSLSSDHIRSFGHHSVISGNMKNMGFDQGLTDKLHQASNPNHPVHTCCYSRCTPIPVSARVRQSVPLTHNEVTRCFDALTTTSAPAPGRADCPAGVQFTGGEADPFDPVQSKKMSGSKSAAVFGKSCCYKTLVRKPPPPPRRPRGLVLHGDDGPVLAPTRTSTEWAARLGELSVPADATKRAAAWERDAAYEHASVAAFARLSLALLSLGAPPALVADAHRAALDEIRHAQMSYGVASALRGSAVGPGPLPATGEPPADLATLALAMLVDGCIGETVATLQAERHAATADDPVLADLHEVIAEDEARHAELAFRIVAWCVEQEPALCDALLASLDAFADDEGVIEGIARPCLLALKDRVS